MKLSKRNSISSRRAQLMRRLLGLESLEGRRLLATITWSSASGGDWAVATNWSPQQVPTAGDDVIIPSLAGSQTITVASGTRAAKTIQVGGDEKLRITGGTLTVSAAEAILKGTGSIEVVGGSLALAGNGWSNTSTLVLASGTLNLGGSFTQSSLGTFVRSSGTVDITGTINGGLSLDATTGPWYLRGGTINGGTITTQGVNTLRAGAFNGPGSFLNGTTIASGSILDMAEQASRITVLNGLTIDGTLLLGGDVAGIGFSTIQLSGTQTIGGSGQVIFGIDQNNRFSTIGQNPVTFSFGSELTLRVRSGVFVGEGSSASKPTFLMQGPIDVVAGGSGLRIHGDILDFITSNSINVEPATTLTISSKNWTNLPTGQITAGPNSTLNLGEGINTWTNQGLISATNATTNLGGSFTQAGLGDFNRTGGTVNVTGTISGGLSLDATTGPWFLRGGTINGGTITTQGVNTLRTAAFNGPGSFLNGTTIASGSILDMAEQASRITVSNGLTIDGTLLLGGDVAGIGFSTIQLSGTQTIGGSGQVIFGIDQNNRFSTIGQNPVTFSFGSELSLRVKSGVFVGEGSSASKPTFLMQGPIDVVAGGSGLRIHGDILDFITSNSINVEPATTLTISSKNWTNLPTGQITAGPNSTLNLSEGINTWTNQGLISATNATINLGGSFTQSGLGNFNRTGGTVTLVGILTDSLTLDAVTGSWLFGGQGRLRNSLLTVSPSVEFRSAGLFTFENVHIAAGTDVIVARNDTSLTIASGLTLNGRLLLGQGINYGALASDFRQSGNGIQTISGSGRIEFNSQSNFTPNIIRSDFNNPATGGTLVIGSGITLSGQRARFVGNGRFVLQGKLELDGAAANVDIEPTGTSSVFINEGTIRSDSGTLNIRPSEFVNSSTGQVITTGGSLLLGGDATQNRTWNNQGLIQVMDTTVSLGGSFTQAGMGTFQRDSVQPGIVTLVGNVTGPLTLTSATGDWRFGGSGRLKDSTLSVHPSVNFQSSGIFTFDNVHVAVGTAVTVASSHLFLTIANGLTLNGRLLLGDNATSYGQLVSDFRLSGSGSQTISGSGRIEFNHQANLIRSNFNNPATGGTLVIGPGITLASQNPAATNERLRFEGNGSILLQGAIVVDGSAARAEIVATRFENQGTLRASNAAVIDVRPTTLVNFADVTNLGGNRFGVTLQGGTFVASDGTIRLFQGTNAAHSFVLKKLEAELILAGTTPRIYGHTTSTTSAITELAEIGIIGHLQLRDGVFYGPGGEVLVRGQVDVDSTSRFGQAPSAPITTVGLKSHFAANGNHFNSATGAESIVATPVNGSGFSTGLDGQGFSFDGVNDHVAIPANPSLNNRSLTVSAWYKLDQLQTGLTVLFGKTIGNGTLNSYSVWLNGDSINYGIGNTGGFDWQGVALVRQVGQWNHVALAFNDANKLVQLYLNGSLLHSFTATRPISYDDGRPHVLGADIENGNPAFFFPGVIDEVRHYDRALSATEIFDIAADTLLVATTIRQVDGEVRVGGSLTSLSQYHLEGGTLFGVGTLPTNLNQSGGTLAPGNSPGCLEIEGDYNLTAAGTLQIEIDGPTVCTQYDQLQVNGSVTLAGALDVLLDPAYSPTIGQKFLVLDNDLSDSIVGQFQYAGSVLRERQVFSVNGNQLFRISYAGGDGNDVELEFLGKGFLVSNASETAPGSLFQAINDANASSGHDLIAFAVDETNRVNGRVLIENTGLIITETITIDGTTQYDFTGTPAIEFRDPIGNSATGVSFAAGATFSELRGLSLTNWTIGTSIAAENVRIAGNFIGIPLDGSAGGGNGIGIEISPSSPLKNSQAALF